MDIISFWPFTLIVALFATSSYVPLPAHAVLVIVSYLTIYAGAHASLDCTEEEVRAVAVSLAAACALICACIACPHAPSSPYFHAADGDAFC